VFFAMRRLRIGRAIAPPHRTALAERPLDVVHSPMRRCFGLQIDRLLGVADRPPGPHQLADEIGSLDLVETGIRHPPQPAADDEVATVWSHGMLHETLG